MNEANDDDNDAASRALFSNEDLVKSFLAPMLQHTEAFQLAQTSTSCRNGVYAFGLVELEKLVSNIRFVHEEPEEYEEEEYEEEEGINIEAFDVPLREWIAQDRTRREIQRKFRRFMETFTEDDDDDLDENNEELMEDGTLKPKKRKKRKNALYEMRIRAMCAANASSLEISYLHLMSREPTLAIWIVDAPRDLLDVLRETATRHTLRLFPGFASIHDEVHVRIADIPILDSLRDLRRSHLDCLVKVNGVVTRRSAVYPQLKMAYYDCIRCKYTLGPFRIEETSNSSGGSTGGGDASELHMPNSCAGCDSEGPFRLNATKSKYRNYQRVNLQETPGSVPPGRVPRSKEVIFTNDLIDAARPGEEVEITGVYSHSYDYHMTQRSGFPVFATFISSNHVRKKEDASSAANLTEADRAQILELARDPKIGDRIVRSIAPSIYGHKEVKMALAMSLFGAVPKNVDDKHRIRGDVNVLLLGDPGTAKSQMLKYAEATAPRAVYSTGKGASAVGLTASVHKDPMTKEWTLEGGALVLADRGVCLIDEFDKMNEQDRTSIHEAMEQQSISLSKAGIVTSLQARCAVIAAANPIGGRYDSSCTLAENVELTDPILQRFDCLCVLQDTVDPVADERLANFVTSSHMRSVPTSDIARGVVPDPDGGGGTVGVDPDIIPQDLLRKYIEYARVNVRPVLRGSTFDQEKIASLYVALRRESSSSGGVPIAVRHIESIMRMSEAHAKMHLREYVRDDDMDASITMMLHSFIMAQKFSVRRSLQRSFAKFLSSREDKAHLLLHILQDMMRNEAMYQTIRQSQRSGTEKGDGVLAGALEVLLEEFESRARDRRIYDVSEFCKGEAFRDAGYVLDERRGIILRNQ
uniref:DNA replication licensing factor MCM2 n=1 Tax=Ditylum brightwellii TaxID=49249 RepID=A0A7S2EDJ0_9STRA|mmetsp:Transcript_25790/g.38323  ORF Transcript_25790/g.38323 Transcript_25790/m.38323 type:complete len:868 (+) Transcript_25790:70-2673(+)